MPEFKFIVGQEVKILSKDRNLNDQTVKIISRHHSEPNHYRVKADWIHGYLSFFEDQIKSIS